MLNIKRDILSVGLAIVASLSVGFETSHARISEFSSKYIVKEHIITSNYVINSELFQTNFDEVDRFLAFSTQRTSPADHFVNKLRGPRGNPFSMAPVKTTIFPTTPVSRDNYNVFRSVAVPVGKLPAFKQWTRVASHLKEGGSEVCADTLCTTVAGKHLADIAEKSTRLARVEALRLINTAVNTTLEYRNDKGDHWATLAESAARGYGDCEDYAIAKMQLLNQAGFAPEQLQFVVLKDTRRQLYHAVLLAHVGGKRYVLDNLSNTIASDEIFRSYIPIASFTGEKSFIHGFVGKTIRTAKLGKGGYAAIRLGETS